MSKPTTRRKKASEEDGFTLLELMIAAGITLMAIVMAMGSLIQISQTTVRTEERTIGQAHLTTIAEEIQDLSLDELVAYQPPALEGLGVMTSTSGEFVAADGTYVPIPPPESVEIADAPNPVEIRLTITWRDSDGRTQSRQLTTFHRR